MVSAYVKAEFTHMWSVLLKYLFKKLLTLLTIPFQIKGK